ncbi:MAG: TIGR03067 domain-containing protein [Opitutaceae bacterium]|nr:TIGR03067 domain-containing protein [Opitutaceae bacterium]
MSVPAAIEGHWVPLKAELAGEAAPAMMLERTELILRAGRYTIRFGGEIFDAGSYAPAASDGHPALLLEGSAGQNAGRKIPCIYQLAGDRLRICYGFDANRPTQFSTQPGTRHYLATYRRKA